MFYSSFNGKEKDCESGYLYYGARYYESELLTGWLGVDPMMDKYPSISPYAYCAWNPVKLVDSDGMDIDSSSVPEAIWNMVNPNHNCYNVEFAEVFNQLATNHTALFSFKEWDEGEIDNSTIVRGRLSLIESFSDKPDNISIGFLWGEDGTSVAPERYMLEEVYHAKQFLDGEIGFGRRSIGGYWGLIGYDMYDEENAHKWADRVSGTTNTWTPDVINYYRHDRNLPESRINCTDHYMNHDGGKRTMSPKYDENGVYKDVGYRTIRKPKN